MSVYAVRKRGGSWTVCDAQKPLMLFDSYKEALEVAQAAASVMFAASATIVAETVPLASSID